MEWRINYSTHKCIRRLIVQYGSTNLSCWRSSAPFLRRVSSVMMMMMMLAGIHFRSLCTPACVCVCERITNPSPMTACGRYVQIIDTLLIIKSPWWGFCALIVDQSATRLRLLRTKKLFVAADMQVLTALWWGAVNGLLIFTLSTVNATQIITLPLSASAISAMSMLYVLSDHIWSIDPWSTYSCSFINFNSAAPKWSVASRSHSISMNASCHSNRCVVYVLVSVHTLHPIAHSL